MVWSNTFPPKPERVLYAKDPATTWLNLKPAESGLINVGNSCYLNASVQALLHIPGIVEFLQHDTAHRASCISLLNCIVCSFYRTYLNMSIHPIFKPSGLVHLLPRLNKDLKPKRQEDAHEFTTFFLDKIEENLIKRCGLIKPDFCSQQTTAIGKIFTIWLEKNDMCLDCSSTFTKYDPTTLMSVPVDSGSVQMAVNSYLDESEIISDFTCPIVREDGDKVCEQRKCSRTYSIHSYPKVLRIVLNRFDHSLEKVSTPVNIERSINFGKAVYHFVSGIVHEGRFAKSGHYTCIAVRSDGKLMHYDDAVVTEGSWFMNSSKTACGIYIVYYQLHHFKPASLKRSPPNTPSKATSPLHKKQHISSVKKSMEKKTKGRIFSPRKFKRKVVDFVRVIFPKKSRKQDNVDEIDKLVEPLTAESGRVSTPRMENRVNDSDSEATATAIVTPIKIKTMPQDSNFSESESTVTALVTPVRIKVPRNSPKASDASGVTSRRRGLVFSPGPGIQFSPLEADKTNNDSDSESTVTASVTPVRIKVPLNSPKACDASDVTSRRRGLVFSPGPSIQFSSNNDSDSEATVTAIVSPPKIEVPTGIPRELGTAVVARRTRSLIPAGQTQNLCAMTEEDCSVNELENDVLSLHELELDLTDRNNNEEERRPKETDNMHSPKAVAAIPLGQLPNPVVDKNKVPWLRKWLKERGKVTTGNKPELVKRVNDCMGDVDLNCKTVGGGKFHNENQQGLLQSQDIARLQDDQIFPTYGWGAFPSRDIPQNFNFGSVYNYLVETMPQMENILNLEDTALHSDDDGSSGNEEEEELVELTDPFLDAECTAIKQSKKLRRGLQYVKSGWLRNVQDTWPDKFHLYKAQIRASYRKESYLVKVALSPLSGSVVRCICDTRCPQRTLGRCSHISALLFFVLMHKNLNGPEAVTCTSKPCTWNTGSLQYKPSVAKARQYESFKIDILRRANFDPRPTKFQTDHPTVQQKNQFLAALGYKEEPSMFQSLWSIQYEDFEYDDEDISILQQKRAQLYEALQHQIKELKPSPQHQGAFEVEGTKSQSSTQKWTTMRALHCSAQPSHQIAHFKTEKAKMNFLKHHLWGIDRITTKAMAYGKRKEPIARKEYAEQQIQRDPTTEVEECGLYLNTSFVGLSCSPDGIKTVAHLKTLLEIKCLYSLRGEDPNKFYDILPKKKLSSFCLERTSTGEVRLKPNHPYYDQIQFSMGIMNLPECDFFLWTDKNTITVTVPFNEKRWFELKEKLEAFHYRYLVPEYFAMRTPRELKPQQIE